MQIMIDVASETPAALRLAAQFLIDHAALKEAIEGGIPAGTESSTSATPPAPAAPVVPPAPTHQAPAMPSNVTPFPQQPAPQIPQAPVVPPAAPQQQAAPAASATTDWAALDKSGFPWDSRIHQQGRTTKKDGTWKLRKGIDPAYVSQITQELHARMINSTASGPPSLPVSLPPGQSTVPVPAVPMPGAPAGNLPTQYGGVPPVPVPQVPAVGGVPPLPPLAEHLPPAPTVPMQPAVHVGMPESNQQAVLPQVGGDFRALVQKITAARTSGKLSAEQITQIVMQAGAPSLQMLGSMSHLVPAVDALIDAALLSV